MTMNVMAIAQELAEISRLVDGDDIPTTLDRFVARVVATVPACDEASIAVLVAQTPELVARSHAMADPVVEPARAALSDQLLRPGGPLHDALTFAEPHRIGEAAADRRWPEFAAAMLNAGYRSGLLLPLPARQGNAAAFTLLSAEKDAFDDVSYDVGLLFALHAGVAFDNAQLFHDSTALVDQLQVAISTRAVIGRAQGILMHRYGVDTQIAFSVLKRGSQNANVKLRDLAAGLIAAQERGALADELAAYGLATDGPGPAE